MTSPEVTVPAADSDVASAPAEENKTKVNESATKTESEESGAAQALANETKSSPPLELENSDLTSKPSPSDR